MLPNFIMCSLPYTSLVPTHSFLINTLLWWIHTKYPTLVRFECDNSKANFASVTILLKTSTEAYVHGNSSTVILAVYIQIILLWYTWWNYNLLFYLILINMDFIYQRTFPDNSKLYNLVDDTLALFVWYHTVRIIMK